MPSPCCLYKMRESNDAQRMRRYIPSYITPKTRKRNIFLFTGGKMVFPPAEAVYLPPSWRSFATRPERSGRWK